MDPLLVDNCTFVDNMINSFTSDSFGGYGGAVYVTTQGISIRSSHFSGNRIGSTESNLNLFPQYTSGGGAIFFSSSKTTSDITNCKFYKNEVTGGGGGAVYLLQVAQINIMLSNFTSNLVWSSYTNRAQGGALMAVKGTFVQVKNCVLESNAAEPRKTLQNPLTYSGEGGAVYIQSSRVYLLEGTSFVNNVVTTGQFDAGAGGIGRRLKYFVILKNVLTYRLIRSSFFLKSLGGAVFLEDAFESVIDSVNFTLNGALGLAEVSTYAAAGVIYNLFSLIRVMKSNTPCCRVLQVVVGLCI